MHAYVLTPGRYLDTEEMKPIAEKMTWTIAELNGQFLESAKLEITIRDNWE